MMQRHPSSHPCGSHAGTCNCPHTCNYRVGENAGKPSAARHVHELLRSSHATIGRLPHVCNRMTTASLHRHQTPHSSGAYTCMRSHTCNYRRGKMPAGPLRHRHMPQVAVIPTSAIAACEIFTDPPKSCVCSGILMRVAASVPISALPA